MLLKKSSDNPLALSVALATVATATLSQSASAATFNFSFSNVEGPVSGTVQGTITLPDGDGTFAATSVIVTSAPAALGYTLPLNILPTTGFLVVNTFTVSAGAITEVSFGVENSGIYTFYLNDGDFGTLLNRSGSLSLDSGVQDIISSSLTFSSAPTAATPEPATVLGLLSIAGVGLLSKRQKQEK